MNCTQICHLSEIKPQKSIIIIDEFQFFNAEELKDFVLKCKQKPIELIMSGLDLLADRTEWTSYTAIKSLCDKLIKLRAICTICGEPAEFSTLISGDKNKKIQIEGEATYEPRCKKHCCD
jgi:thymidine kinase